MTDYNKIIVYKLSPSNRIYFSRRPKRAVCVPERFIRDMSARLIFVKSPTGDRDRTYNTHRRLVLFARGRSAIFIFVYLIFFKLISARLTVVIEIKTTPPGRLISSFRLFQIGRTADSVNRKRKKNNLPRRFEGRETQWSIRIKMSYRLKRCECIVHKIVIIKKKKT